MKKLPLCLIILLSLTIMTGLNSCDTDDPTEQPGINPNTNPNPNPDPQPPATGNKGTIKVGSVTFAVTYQDNPTAQAFRQLLPVTIHMSELNSNEKYYGLPNPLPTNATNPGTIYNGDLMLYGSNTLVLFYKTFSTSYSYTRIGSIDNPSELQNALGGGSATVTFQLQE